ncbi:bifunctional 2-polyprenyl-6-hydroxyphenol methylase/3-demethylubiquinol 3-O-methyltransferase UbiG [Nocardia sp. BMG111209]|uniref:class I SAM-dependent methyltransferase n=1 Tax=Nocardia sp. BMG111209 TaxID=1160137 RepID=UPI000361C944|nr:class I SAM-dependent methyltransferase [Nocardia sp. BMG111209]
MDAADWDARYTRSELVRDTPPDAVVAEHATALQRSLAQTHTGEPPRALDLGCGEGRHALWLATHGWQVVAVDFSQAGIDKGRTLAARLSRSARGRIAWHCADVTDSAALPDYHVDLVLLTDLPLPPPQRRMVLLWAAEVLNPEGALLVLAHDDAPGHDPDTLFTPEDILHDLAPIAGRLRVRVAERIPQEQTEIQGTLVVMTRIAPGEHGTIAL